MVLGHRLWKVFPIVVVLACFCCVWDDKELPFRSPAWLVADAEAETVPEVPETVSEVPETAQEVPETVAQDEVA